MKQVKIDNLVIGSGRPKVCVPVVAHNLEELKSQAGVIAGLPADLVEWRVDFFDEWQNAAAVRQAAHTLKEILPVPLLFTFRTANEGGEREITAAEYRELLLFTASLDEISLIDVEVFFESETVADIMRGIHEAGKFVLASNHDFHRTPSSGELKNRLLYMEETGADIAKIAVMPQSKSDVFRLMEVTAAVQGQDPGNFFSCTPGTICADTECENSVSASAVHAFVNIPVVTMSMGSLGVLSRVAGEFTGSAITFGAAGQASAPGQVDVRKLSEILELLHSL